MGAHQRGAVDRQGPASRGCRHAGLTAGCGRPSPPPRLLPAAGGQRSKARCRGTLQMSDRSMVRSAVMLMCKTGLQCLTSLHDV